MDRLHFFSFAVLSMLIALLGSDAMAQLGPASYRSLQATVHNSEVVLVGRILKIEGEREQLGRTTYKIRFEEEEVIKGGYRERGYFYLFAEREQIETWIESRARLLLNSPYKAHSNSESAEVTIDLTEPKLGRLSLGEDGVLTTVDTTKRLLEILRKTAQRLPGVVQMRTFQMPTEPDFVKRANLLIQDGLPIVFVPVDKPLETWAKRVIAGDTELPIDDGVRALTNFKSEENIKWLRLAIETAIDDRNREALTGLLKKWNGGADQPATAEENRTKQFTYTSLPRFGIPGEFYTEHDYFPAKYLLRYTVSATTRDLDQAEKLSAALLVLAANHATYKKYGQSYGVDMSSPLMKLLQHNFPGLKDVEATHDVNENHLPIRDLAKFFKKWLAKNT